jgi:hypothetical protein
MPPCSLEQASLSTRPDREANALPEPPAGGGKVADRMSTRRLIVAALLCGLAIIVAFTVQVVLRP